MGEAVWLDKSTEGRMTLLHPDVEDGIIFRASSTPSSTSGCNILKTFTIC